MITGTVRYPFMKPRMSGAGYSNTSSTNSTGNALHGACERE